MKDQKIFIRNLVLSSAIVLSMAALAVFFFMGDNSKDMVEIDVTTTSEIVSTDPMETAARFIKANGTMGDVETDIVQDKMKTNEALYENGARRQIALHQIKEAVIPGGPIISGYEESHIKIHTRDLDTPYIYSISNIEVSEPSEPEKIQIFAPDGQKEYESVKVNVLFDSTRISYSYMRDTSYDGTHTQISNTESFAVEVILVNSGDLWFVYDIPDSEYLLNERFATWDGISDSTINYDNDKVTGEFKLEGVPTYDSE